MSDEKNQGDSTENNIGKYANTREASVLSTTETLGLSNANHLEKLYDGWFLDYASYVILDRAVPYFEDGLKPVQRRILHSLFEMNDGRFNKVANVVGNTMRYHPHGDASIYEALVGLGQKNLLVETQGNWGNPFTGDPAAAPRYIEGRLSQFALEVLFNAETTEWIPSYDGRSKEPVALPAKFPLLLAQGVDGIAVGLSTYILPHNFCELCEASIAYLKGKKFTLYPDFFTGGTVDISHYDDGARGGKVKVRAKIEVEDSKTLVIREIPYGTTTGSLIESIVAANEKGKIKIKRVDDNTAQNVEIIIHLLPGTEPQKMIEALYAFTNCEMSLSPCTCVIVNKKPAFITTTDILKLSTDHTVKLLEWELKNELNHLQEKWHATSLEKIFIEREVYEVIKESKNREEMVALIGEGLKPYTRKLRREATTDDILKLAEIPVRRLSHFDRKKTDEYLKELDEKIAEVEGLLAHLTDYAIAHFKNLEKKYGEGRERKTQIAEFGKVEAVHIAMANQKFFVNRKEGFIGTGLKKEEYLFDVSEYDDIIAFKADGTYKVVRVSDKDFVGKDILLVEKFKKDDERRIYNAIYQDGKDGPALIKRFNVGGITHDKDYPMGKGKPGTKMLYLSSNPNGEAEVVEIILKPRPRIKLNFEVDFSLTEVKGRNAIGNIVTKYPVRTIKKVSQGVSTLGAKIYYFDAISGIVSTQKKGDSLGEFAEEDKLISVRTNGMAKLHDMTDPILVGTDILYLGKYDPEQVFSVLYFEGDNFNYMVKRFTLENCPTSSEFNILSDHPDTRMVEFFSTDEAKVLMEYQAGHEVKKEELDLTEVADIKTYKALGSKFTAKKVKRVTRIENEPKEELPGDKKDPNSPDLFG
ncbi:MAG: DNA gyrase/topoisomerase IV subunit A [Fibrobacteraceae bacterium]|nr:DNA gyrase/topoisomerase IV subunit A [Fibrobacteraceae bacterium]